MLYPAPMRRIIPLLFTLLLIGCAQTTPVEEGTSASSGSSATISTSSPASSGAILPPQTYKNTEEKFSVFIPSGWVAKDQDGVITEAYEATGSSLIYAGASGTTLSEAKLNIAVQQSCPSLSASVSMSEVIDGIVFIRSTWEGAAAGNLYEGVTWMGTRDGKCYVLTGYLHSCNLGPDCGPGRTTPFNKASFLSAFETMVRSLKFE